MVATRTENGTPLDITNGGDNDGNGANRAVLTQDEGQRAPEEQNNDEVNANDGEDSSSASDEGAGGGEMDLNLRFGMASGLDLKVV